MPRRARRFVPPQPRKRIMASTRPSWVGGNCATKRMHDVLEERQRWCGWGGGGGASQETRRPYATAPPGPPSNMTGVHRKGGRARGAPRAA